MDAQGLPQWLSGLKIHVQCRRHRSRGFDPWTRKIPGLRRSPGVGSGNPLQYSCQENPRDSGTWQAIVQRVTKSQTWWSMTVMFTMVSFPTEVHSILGFSFPWVDWRRQYFTAYSFQVYRSILKTLVVALFPWPVVYLGYHGECSDIGFKSKEKEYTEIYILR